MGIGVMSEADKAKIRELVNQGVAITKDIETLREGLRETVDAVAQDLEIKKTTLNKAIRTAFKMQENRDALTEGREEMDEVEEILMIVNRN